MISKSNQPLDPLAVTIRDAGRLLSLGRTSVYELLESGVLSSFRVGRRRLVTYESIARLVASHAGEAATRKIGM